MALPPITLNRQFFKDFTKADAPCCALGLVRSDDAVTGFFAMKPEVVVPSNVFGMGIGFGHWMLTSPDGEPVCEFVFNFHGFAQHSVLVNPSSQLVLKAIESMIVERDYFCFILSPDGRASAFRMNIGEGHLAGMLDGLPMMQSTRTPQSSYESCVQEFRQVANPTEVKTLDWVCRDDPVYLDLELDAFTLPALG